MNTPKIEMRDPATLKPLPFVKAMTRWATDSDEFKGFKDDIREHGIKHPLQITVDGRVVDGWTRCLAARAWQMTEVPCVVVDETETGEIILRELLLRRNLTKGQRAYVSAPIIGETYESRRLRRLKNIAKGQQIMNPTELDSGRSQKEWVALLGFSDELLMQANWLRDCFKKHPELAEEWEPKILAGESPVGLGAAKAGIVQQLEAGKNPGKYDPKQASQMELFRATFSRDFRNRFEFWNANKKEAAAIVEHTAATMSRQECLDAAAALRDMAKIYESEAKVEDKE